MLLRFHKNNLFVQLFGLWYINFCLIIIIILTDIIIISIYIIIYNVIVIIVAEVSTRKLKCITRLYTYIAPYYNIFILTSKTLLGSKL